MLVSSIPVVVFGYMSRIQRVIESKSLKHTSTVHIYQSLMLIKV